MLSVESFAGRPHEPRRCRPPALPVRRVPGGTPAPHASICLFLRWYMCRYYMYSTQHKWPGGVWHDGDQKGASERERHDTPLNDSETKVKHLKRRVTALLIKAPMRAPRPRRPLKLLKPLIVKSS